MYGARIETGSAHLHAVVKGKASQDGGCSRLRAVCINLLQPLVHLQA